MLWLKSIHVDEMGPCGGGSLTSDVGVRILMTPGGRLNKKDHLTGYGDSHVKDKTSYRPSYL